MRTIRHQKDPPWTNAAQALAVIDELGLDEERVNPNGGAIVLGHPIAATGAAIATKILDEMERADHELGS